MRADIKCQDLSRLLLSYNSTLKNVIVIYENNYSMKLDVAGISLNTEICVCFHA